MNRWGKTETIIVMLVMIFMCCCYKAAVYRRTPDLPAYEEPAITDKWGGDFIIWTDPDTGIQYIVYSCRKGGAGMGGITPRLGQDGGLYTE